MKQKSTETHHLGQLKITRKSMKYDARTKAKIKDATWNIDRKTDKNWI